MQNEPTPETLNSRTIEVVVEIARGGRNKYEWDEVAGRFRLDRVLYSSIHYPTDYGYSPETLAPDGDTLDVLIAVEEPTFTGCLVTVRPIGTLDMRDEKGEDHKILSVPANDPRFDHVRDLSDLGQHWLLEIENFFQTYKTLEDKFTEVLGWHGADVAWTVIEDARERFRRAQLEAGAELTD
jgi:inorganic pyrophosphatase